MEHRNATGSLSEGGAWNKARTYTVPGHLVRDGESVLVVRAIDTVRAGGLWGGAPQDMYLVPADDDAVSERIPLAGDWRYRVGVQLAQRLGGSGSRQLPGFLFNGMVHPLHPYSIRGAVWYQGESNVGDGAAYRAKMETLINSWRRLWRSPRLPFFFVQLAPFRYGAGHALPEIWEAQADVLHAVANTGMAVITDVADLDNIHPGNKRAVGERLARWALAGTYGRDVVPSGPLYQDSEIEGAAVRVRFAHADGLRSSDGEALTWFEVADADSQFVTARAAIDGDDVLVSSPKVASPRAVRFGWHEEAEPNLVNGAGLPASPFRTDRW